MEWRVTLRLFPGKPIQHRSGLSTRHADGCFKRVFYVWMGTLRQFSRVESA